MKNKLFTHLISTCLVITFSFAVANDLPIESNVPGGVVIVPIKSKDRPKAFFYDRKVMVIGKSQNWKAIVGIPLKIELGEHKLKVVSNSAEANYLFEGVSLKKVEDLTLITDDIIMISDIFLNDRGYLKKIDIKEFVRELDNYKASIFFEENDNFKLVITGSSLNINNSGLGDPLFNLKHH